MLMSTRATGTLLWVAAVVLMVSAAVYQERTGPTYPLKGETLVDGQARRYRLPRTEESVRDARIAIPSPGPDAIGLVTWRRYPTDDPFQSILMVDETDEDGRAMLVAQLPAQPAAGKLEYRVDVSSAAGTVRIPSDVEAPDDATIVMRYKDPVPLPILISHVAFMFFAMLVGMRAALAALFAPAGMHRLSWVSLGLMSVGGLVFGPIVQKHAFGAFWEGIPFGYDLTDNKTLIMWVVWVGACAIVGWKPRSERPSWRARLAVLGAAVVMTTVYLIPHSLRGSELDYAAVDAGTPPSEAIGTER